VLKICTAPADIRRDGFRTPQTVDHNSTMRGIFATDSSQTLVLLLDLKTNGKHLLPHIQKHLQPLREAHLLSFTNGTQFISRPVTIVVSGNEPYDLISRTNTNRDIFFDAPLSKLRNPQSRSWNSANSLYASTSFRRSIGFPWTGRLSSKQLSVIRDQIEEAHRRGLKVRYWGTPPWPIWLRDRVWQTLLDEGVDVLNVDDLGAAALVDWRTRTTR
jgi:hypothetical protein